MYVTVGYICINNNVLMAVMRSFERSSTVAEVQLQAAGSGHKAASPEKI